MIVLTAALSTSGFALLVNLLLVNLVVTHLEPAGDRLVFP